MKCYKKLIVIIDDEILILGSLKLLLENEGFEVKTYSSGEDFLFDKNRPIDCQYLLDWGLRGLQGTDLIKIIRIKDKTSHIFMMSANNYPEQILEGLQAGADDYITKPFSYEELITRIKNACFKAGQLHDSSISTGLRMLPEANSILINGQYIKFTPREFIILQVLYTKNSIPTTRGELMEKFGEDLNAEDRIIDVHISKLRKKLNKIKTGLEIVTVRGEGYKLILL